MTGPLQLRTIEPIARPSVADQVFETLSAQILSTEIPPGTKMSEADVARQLEVSRQPVRDAFFRLSQLGFLVIRPQRATTVSQISARSIAKARFIRTAIEVEIVRRACAELTEADFGALETMLAEQQDAIDAGNKLLFHELDDGFHRMICERLGLGFAWDVIRESKAHTDRIRFLSLSFASQTSRDDHGAILAALRARDPVSAEAAMRAHLGRIMAIVARLRAENHSWFMEED